MKYLQNVGGGVEPTSASRPDISGCYSSCHFFKRIILQTVFLLFFAVFPSLAEDSKPITAMTGKDTVVEFGDADTHLAVDTEKNIIRIMIEGKEVGRFDKSGFHVVGDIEFTGSMTDTTASSWLADEVPLAKGADNVE